MTAVQNYTQSELTAVVQKIIDSAMQQSDVTAVSAGGSVSSGLSVSVRLGKVDTVEFNRDKSLGITVYKDKCKGSVSITDFSDAAIIAAIQAACRIATYTEPDIYNGLADKNLLATDIPDLQLNHPAAISAEQAIEYATQCEAAALDFDKRITNSDGGNYATHAGNYVYGNSEGFLAAFPTTRYSASCVVIGQQGDNMQRDYDYTMARDVHDLTALKQVGESAAQKTIARLGARKITTRKAPVLFVPRMAMSLWGCLVSAISGASIYRKSSFLLDSVDKKIFPDFINIYEDPHLLKAIGSAPFDDEGVATKRKMLITEGVLNTYLLGSYSARRLGLQSTGNAGGVHNFTVQANDLDFAALVKTMHTGLIVTELLGNGTNIVTGDYSHGAAGLWVENGVIQYPVQEITIAGNLCDMFNTVVAVGNDVDRRSNNITGSILLDSMMIAGD